MHHDSLLATIGYPALFCTPWAIGIVWVLLRTRGAVDSTPAPSWGEVARRRLGI